MVKNPPAMQETPVRFKGQKDSLEDRLPTPVFLDFPGGSDGKESSAMDQMQETWVQSLGWEDPLEK